MEVILEMIVALNAAIDTGATSEAAFSMLALMIAQRVQAEFAAGKVTSTELRGIRKMMQHIGRRCEKLHHRTSDTSH